MVRHLDDLFKIKIKRKMKLVVVGSHDENILEAIVESANKGMITPILVGDKIKTLKIAEKLAINIDDYEIIDQCDINKISEIGVKIVSSGKADFLIKGNIHTSTLLKAVLNKEWGLRTGKLLSHVMIYDIPTYNKLIYLTDGGMNINPTIYEKKDIIENAGAVARALGNKEIKVASLAAKETIDENMRATVDGDKLKSMYNNKEFTKDIIVDGPMALDLAISKKAAMIKGFESSIAGDADVLLVPNVEMGNGIGKSITYFANGKSAGVVMGAKVPIVLVSRGDDSITKLYSIALGCIIMDNLI